MTFLSISHRMGISALVLAALVGCAVSVKESKKVGRLSVAPDT